MFIRKQYENESFRLQAEVARNVTLRVFIGAFFAFMFFATLISSITYYNVQALKVPVKYEETHEYDYERGGQEE